MSKPRLATLQPGVKLLDLGVKQATSPAWGDSRQGSRHARGYGTAWDHQRLRILQRDGYLCQCKRCKGGDLRVRPATHVDHVISKAEWKVTRPGDAGCEDDSNLQAINVDCHKLKTDEDRKRVLAAYRGGLPGFES